MLVLETKPNDAVSIIECDMQVCIPIPVYLFFKINSKNLFDTQSDSLNAFIFYVFTSKKENKDQISRHKLFVYNVIGLNCL